MATEINRDEFLTNKPLPKRKKEFEIYRKREMDLLESDFDRKVKKLKEK